MKWRIPLTHTVHVYMIPKFDRNVNQKGRQKHRHILPLELRVNAWGKTLRGIVPFIFIQNVPHHIERQPYTTGQRKGESDFHQHIDHHVIIVSKYRRNVNKIDRSICYRLTGRIIGQDRRIEGQNRRAGSQNRRAESQGRRVASQNRRAEPQCRRVRIEASMG